MVSLNDYQDGFLGGAEQGANDLLKAMEAGQITGRDTTGLPLTQEPLKVESLEKTLKLLEFRTSDIKLFNALPKMTAYNTVEEFLQLASYGAERGGFYNEGELSDVEDSTYIRRAEHVKYMQVTGEVTLQAQMVKSFVDAMRKEIQNKIMWILRLANRSMTKANADIIPQEFNGLYKQHASVGLTPESLWATNNDYYNSGVVIDLRGATLKQDNVEDGATTVDLNYGSATDLFAPTTVISNLSKDYYQRQRIIMDANGYDGIIGATPKAISTTLGDITLNSDKFMSADQPKKLSDPSTSSKAPSAPQSLSAALESTTLAKFTKGEEGSVFYAVSAINRHGESNLTPYSTAVSITENNAVDLTITASASANSASGYVIYRSEVVADATPTNVIFYPIFKISVADVANGYNGASAGVVRDLGHFMPNTEQAFITQMDEEVLGFKQLAPISKLDLATLAMSRRFITFLFGTPILFVPKKMVRYINIGKRFSA